MTAQGPLAGVKVIEFAGIGPGPFCGMLLSDLGADVVRIDRKGQGRSSPADITARGRRSIALDLKRPEAVETGWGQTGPLALAAGHDINYIALTGALHAIGLQDKPVPPLNLVGDFGGGALYLAFGMMAALVHARSTGKGQVVDTAMTDGAASLMSMFYGMKAAGVWTDARKSNLLDGGAHMYDTYQCKDGKWVAIGSLEPQFYALLLEKTGISDPEFSNQMDRAAWPTLKSKLAAVLASKTRDEWCVVMEGTDVCFAPVLSLEEAPNHPHNVARSTFVTVEGVVQPAPAPRFSATPGRIQGPPPKIGGDNEAALADWGLTADEVTALKEVGAL